MNKENNTILPNKEHEKLMVRLAVALSTIKKYENKLTDGDISNIERAVWEIEGCICRKDSGSYWRDWYPMSGTIEEIEGK